METEGHWPVIMKVMNLSFRALHLCRPPALEALEHTSVAHTISQSKNKTSEMPWGLRAHIWKKPNRDFSDFDNSNNLHAIPIIKSKVKNFSKLSIIKLYFTMTLYQRLNYFSIHCIEDKITPSLSYEEVIKEHVAKIAGWKSITLGIYLIKIHVLLLAFLVVGVCVSFFLLSFIVMFFPILNKCSVLYQLLYS